MNNRQAIEVLKDFDSQVTEKADGAYQSTVGKMACDLAIVALERRIPKKPTNKDNCGSASRCTRYPNCFEIVSENEKYCGNCGQLMNWSKK